ncbi:MAG: signal peptidase II [Oscillospiraceae bacterium]|jgi:signal peptidase II|nr:signal peptidase II [Oscillospiraceae bacterium]
MLFFIFSGLIVLLDQLLKYWTTVSVELGGRVELLRNVIHITHVKNSGAAFGIFSDMRWVLIAVSALCIVALSVVIVHYRNNFWGRIGLASVLGGAVGNFIDRLAVGEVIDMFEFEFISFAIFNVADIFITLGGIVFCLAFIIKSPSGAAKRLAAGAARAPSPERAAGAGADDESSFTLESILQEYYTDKMMSDDDGDDAR